MLAGLVRAGLVLAGLVRASVVKAGLVIAGLVLAGLVRAGLVIAAPMPSCGSSQLCWHQAHTQESHIVTEKPTKFCMCTVRVG